MLNRIETCVARVVSEVADKEIRQKLAEKFADNIDSIHNSSSPKKRPEFFKACRCIDPTPKTIDPSSLEWKSP